MIENLLYPKKLTEPPQLLVDVETLFYKGGNVNTNLVGFDYMSSIKKPVKYKFISVGEDGPDTFRFSFIADVTGITNSDNVYTAIALPFQDIKTDVVGVKCHGWNATSANIMSTPNKTVEKTPESMTKFPEVIHAKMSRPDGHRFLFKMESSEFEDNGSGKKFSSLLSGCSICFRHENSDGDIKSEFPEIFNNYRTTAIEIIVKVTVCHQPNLPIGFRLGIAQL